MLISDLPNQAGEWLKGTGSESDIVISSRIRLARNIVGYPFTSRLKGKQKKELEKLLRNGIMSAGISDDMNYLNLTEFSSLDRQLLVERHLISKEHAEGQGDRGVAFEKNEVASLMVNEEDHLRIQVIKSGFELEETWRIINEIDDSLENVLNYAFSPDFGYLTACPTNVGTGMRVSVMVHLPALDITKHLEKVFNAVLKINLVVRGLYGEGTQASGDFFQISNQVTLGQSEEEIIKTVESAVPQITNYERRAREALLSENRSQLEDRVWRAYGMLKYAQSISSEETMQLLSQVRMGINLGLIDDVGIRTINQLFILVQPAHLQKLEKRTLESADRNAARAALIRNHLNAK